MSFRLVPEPSLFSKFVRLGLLPVLLCGAIFLLVNCASDTGFHVLVGPERDPNVAYAPHLTIHFSDGGQKLVKPAEVGFAYWAVVDVENIKDISRRLDDSGQVIFELSPTYSGRAAEVILYYCQFDPLTEQGQNALPLFRQYVQLPSGQSSRTTIDISPLAEPALSLTPTLSFNATPTPTIPPGNQTIPPPLNPALDITSLSMGSSGDRLPLPTAGPPPTATPRPLPTTLIEPFEHPAEGWLTGPLPSTLHQATAGFEKSRLIIEVTRFGGQADHIILPYPLPVLPPAAFRLSATAAFLQTNPEQTLGLSLLLHRPGEQIIIRFGEDGYFAVYRLLNGELLILNDKRRLRDVKFKAKRLNQFEVVVANGELLLYVNKELQDRVSLPAGPPFEALSLGLDGRVGGGAQIALDAIEVVPLR